MNSNKTAFSVSSSSRGESEGKKEEIDHLFRHTAGKMVAVVTHFLGLHNLQLAEDVVQDSFIKALQTWPLNGPPANGEAWLLQVAKNLAIDQLRRQELHSRFTRKEVEDLIQHADEFFHEQEISDSQLRMIFACCHPAIKQEDQIALTLQIVSAFSMSEIARALLTNEVVVQKRISRAKKFLREENIPLEIPAGSELTKRLDTVYTVLYLLFNEGYNSLKSTELIRKDLCIEAMRCCQLLTEHPQIKQVESAALMALMCLHASRFDSRMNLQNEIIVLEEQDRSLWDYDLIQLGLHFLQLSSEGDRISSYHIEAAIAAEHAITKNFKSTNWQRLLDLYDLLLHIKPSPVAYINRAVVLAQLGQTENAIASVLSIPNIDSLIKTDHLYSAVLGELYKRLSNTIQAQHYLSQAQVLTPSLAEKKLLQLRLDELIKMKN
jgi:RNA polymerase sigma-70 factor (ECF subfamily)